MKTMKKFSYLFTVALATVIGFASCSSDDDNGTDPAPTGGTKSIDLSIKIGDNTQLRSDAGTESANGLTPDVKDLTLYFHDGTTILNVQSFPITLSLPSTATTETFTVPQAVTGIYAIGNTTTIANSIAISVTPGTTTLAQLKASLIDMAKQSHPKTAVNVKGETSSITAGGGVGGNDKANIDLSAAVSRIEVAKVESTGGAGSTVTTPLTKFDLTAIYINNTYTQFGLNETTTGGTTLNFDKTTWAANEATYPAIYKNTLTAMTGGASYTPSTTSFVWGFFVPANANTKGTTFPNPSGAGTATPVDQTAVPHIILKIENATAPGMTIPAVQYVTVKGLKNAGVLLDNLKAGTFYLVTSINIGAEHLSNLPEDPTIKLDVEVKVLPWSKVDVTPEF